MGVLWLWADSQDIVRGVECRRYSHCTPPPPCIERLFLLFLYLKWNTMHVHLVFTPSIINSLHVLYSTEEQVQVIQFKWNQSDKISPFEKECRMGICNLVNFDLWWQIVIVSFIFDCFIQYTAVADCSVQTDGTHVRHCWFLFHCSVAYPKAF